MIKTILSALKDEIHYPVPDGFLENKLIKRGLSGADEYSSTVANSSGFQGALADCYIGLLDAVNFSDGDKSVALPDRDLLLKKANAIYKSIGEQTISDETPIVYIE